MQLGRKSFFALTTLSFANTFALAGCAKTPAAGAGSGSGVGSAWAGGASSGSAVGSAAATADLANTYSAHGALRVGGTHVVDASGTPFQLRGVSTHGLDWFPQFVNRDSFATWQGWGANAARLACYTDENGGWLTDGDHDALLATIDAGVQAATDLDMYAIVDWHVLHDQNPLPNLAAAQDFFSIVCDRYADRRLGSAHRRRSEHHYRWHLQGLRPHGHICLRRREIVQPIQQPDCPPGQSSDPACTSVVPGIKVVARRPPSLSSSLMCAIRPRTQGFPQICAKPRTRG